MYERPYSKVLSSCSFSPRYQAKPWANVNGFCLSWPPAVRVSGRAEAELLVQIRKAMPVPTPLYQEELSAPLKGTHVVAFELRRRAASVMWTLTLPVFLVTTLSFCQYGVLEAYEPGTLDE